MHTVGYVRFLPTTFENNKMRKLYQGTYSCYSVHEGKNQFKCDICNANFVQTGTLNRHVAAVHEGKNHSNVIFVMLILHKKGDLKIHIATVHEQKKQFQCDLCNVSFAQIGNLNQHIATVHEEKKNNSNVTFVMLPSHKRVT